MRRILADDEPLELTMARAEDVADGALAILRRTIRNDGHPELSMHGVELVRRCLFVAYVDARDHGRRDEADKLVRLVKPSPIAGEVVIKRAPRRNRGS